MTAALLAPLLLAAAAAPGGAEQTWHAGAGLSAGDYFRYSVCETECYEVSLDFRAKMVSGGRPLWVVQAEASGSGQHILLLDPATMEVRPAAYDHGLSGSLSRTLLHISQYAPPHDPKPLEPGSSWGPVPGAPVPGTQLIVAARGPVEAGGASHEAALLQYTVFETSTLAVAPDLPFPVSAAFYVPRQTVPDPPVAFAFELSGYSRGDLASIRDASVPDRGQIPPLSGAP